MKKLIKALLLMLTFLVVAPSLSAQTYGMSEKEIKANQKSAEKQAKNQAKQLKKEKWIYSGANMLEDELTRYLLATNFSNGKKEAMVQNVLQAKTIYEGERLARSAAENDFSRELRTAIKGEIAELNGNASSEYTETMVDKWEKRIASELKGDIKRHFYIYKQNPDKTFQVRVYFSKPTVGNSAIQNVIKNNLEFLEDMKGSWEKPNE